MQRLATFVSVGLMACSLALAQQNPSGQRTGEQSDIGLQHPQGNQVGAQPAAAEMQPAESAQVKQAIEDKTKNIDQAAMNNNMDAYQRDIPSDWRLVDQNGQLMTRDQVVQNYQSGSRKLSSISRQHEQVRVIGNTAVDSGVMNVQGQENGKDISGQYRFTNVWVQQNGTWQPISSQWTPIAGQTAGAKMEPGAEQEKK